MTLRTDRSRANLYSDAPSPLAKKGVGKSGQVNSQLKSAPYTSEDYRNSHGGKPKKVK